MGVRYCGGCNPRYERVAMIQQAQSLMGDCVLFARHDEEALDGLIVVKGCPRGCGGRALIERKVPYHSIIAEGDLKSLSEWLFTLQHKK